jgi:hypothetical protein
MPTAPLTASQKAFQDAPPKVQALVKVIIQDERLVQHQRRRVLPNNEGIHEALLRHIKQAES